MSVAKGVKSAAKLPTGVAKPKKSPETQALSDCLDYSTLIKADGSHIYTRKLPGENGKKTLRIDGPGDSAVALDSEGTIRLITGIHDPNRGAASGKLLIKTQGQQQMHKEPSVIQYNAGGENKEALNVLCYGDSAALKKAGHNTERFGFWAWLVPVYLFKRASALKQSQNYFIVWMLLFLVTCFCSASAAGVSGAMEAL